MNIPYKAWPASQVIALIAAFQELEEDGYISEDKMVLQFLDAIRDGYRWTRTESGIAIFEQAVTPQRKIFIVEDQERYHYDECYCFSTLEKAYQYLCEDLLQLTDKPTGTWQELWESESTSDKLARRGFNPRSIWVYESTID